MVFTPGALKNFVNFSGKILVLESFFKKASGPQGCNLLKRDPTQVFSCEIDKIFKSSFFTEHVRCLAFKISNSNILFKDFSGIPLTCN